MKKTLQLFCLAFLAVMATSAQNNIGDSWVVDEYEYVVTGINDGGVTGTLDEVDVKTTAAVTVPTDVVIPSIVNNGSFDYTVTGIGDGAFSAKEGKGAGYRSDNTNIVTVSLPASVTHFNGAHQFRDNPNLTTINLENIVNTGGNTFVNCFGLPAVMDLPKCEVFGPYTFVFCTNISQVNIPVATSIGEGALRGTGITTMTIPASVTRIEGQLFRQCFSLAQVKLNWADPSTILWENEDASKVDLHVSTWTNIDPTVVKIWVPATTKAAYEVTEPWLNAGAAQIQEGDILSTSNVEKALGFSLYPNPTNGIVSIKSKQLIDASITVYDINGRALLSKTLSNTASEINISNLASGLYIFRVQTENGEFSKRIVKQ